MTNGSVTRSQIFSVIQQYNLRHQVNDFPSGCSMIDIWINDNLVVIQVEPDRIGFSMVNEPDFSTIADEYFTDVNIILDKIRFLAHKAK
jgi:hypothetical protein